MSTRYYALARSLGPCRQGSLLPRKDAREPHESVNIRFRVPTMHRLKPSFGAYPTLMPETLPIQARGQFSGLAGAGPPCHFWLSPSHIVLLSSSMQGLPICAIPGRITTTQHRTISPRLISTCTPLKIRQLPQLLVLLDVFCILHCPFPVPIQSPARPCHTMPWLCSSGFISARMRS